MEPTKQKYLFLLAWVSESDGNCGEYNGINSQEDLFPQYQQNNEAVFFEEYEAYSFEEAAAYGYRDAFFENYTATNTVSEIRVWNTLTNQWEKE